MMKFFLRLKHWQLFILMFALPMVLYIYFSIHYFSSFSAYAEPDIAEVQEAVVSLFRMLSFIIVPVMIIFYGWFWSVGVGLQESISPDLRLRTGTFKAIILASAIYSIAFFFFISSFMSSMFDNLEAIESGDAIFPFNPMLMVLIIPLHLLLMVGSIYCLYFMAKTFKTAELQREVKFGDFISEFVLIWFYFVGIWILQPKINKLADPVQPPPLPFV